MCIKYEASDGKESLNPPSELEEAKNIAKDTIPIIESMYLS